MISKVRIENFRSIKELELETSSLCSLIGPNSAGKSNVLKALDILLGEIYPSERAFTKDDFFQRDTDSTISIQVWFRDELSPVRLTRCGQARGKALCTPVSFKFIHTRKEDAGFGSTGFSVFDKNGEEFFGNSSARDQISFIYVPSDRELEKQMTVSNWTLLGKILKKIDENFRKKDPGQELSELEKQLRSAMEAPKEILESEFDDGLSYKIFKDEFLNSCEENTRGLASNFSLDLKIYDPLFYYKTIQIIGNEDLGEFNVNELGSGVQNLVLLSLFKSYAKLMKEKAILAIEEPEIYLHPQAQRKLYKNFLDLTNPRDDSEATQIFYTTHSPNFVDASRTDQAILLFKDEEVGTHKLERSEVVTAESLKADRFRIYTHFNAERNEIFFAKKVILVEGASDRILFTTLCTEKWDFDLDKDCVSVVECGGKSGVIYFIGVCRLLGIKNFFAVWDQDSESDVDDKYQGIKYSLEHNQGLEIPDNLEKFLTEKFPGMVFREKRKVEDAYVWASTVEVSKIPSEFDVIKEFLNEN